MEYKDQQKVNEKPNSIQSLLKILIDNEDQSLNSDQLRDIQTELNKELHNKEVCHSFFSLINNIFINISI